MSFFSKLFSKKSDEGLQSIKSADTVAVLKRLKEHRSPVTLTFSDNKENHYSSIVLDVDSKKGCYVLGDLMPKEGNEIMVEEAAFQASASDLGVNVNFSGKAFRAVRENGTHSFYVELPDDLDHQQQRNSFRVSVPSYKEVSVALPLSLEVVANTADEKQQPEQSADKVIADVLDISLTGCRIRFPCDVGNLLEKTKLLHGAELRIGGEQTLTFDIDLCNIIGLDDRKRSIVGAKFYRLPPKTEQEITRFIALLQRELRRKYLGLE